MNEIKSGIYKIVNIKNNKLYIGSSKNIENRWKQHLALLKCGKHHSQHLQYSWNKYGKDLFCFEIIEDNVAQDDLLNREQFWMDSFQSYNPQKGYNISCVAGACIMNDDYNFEEIVDEQYELENKYEVIHMILNTQNDEIVYDSNINTEIDVCIFNRFLCEINKFFYSIDFNSWYQIELFNDELHTDIQDFYNIPYKIATNIILTSNFSRVVIYDPESGDKLILYKDFFKDYKLSIVDGNLKGIVYDKYDFIKVFIRKNKE